MDPTIERAQHCVSLCPCVVNRQWNGALCPDDAGITYSATQRAISTAAADTLSVYQLDPIVIYGEQIRSNS
jgi:hypothetical protein